MATEVLSLGAGSPGIVDRGRRKGHWSYRRIEPIAELDARPPRSLPEFCLILYEQRKPQQMLAFRAGPTYVRHSGGIQPRPVSFYNFPASLSCLVDALKLSHYKRCLNLGQAATPMGRNFRAEIESRSMEDARSVQHPRCVPTQDT